MANENQSGPLGFEYEKDALGDDGVADTGDAKLGRSSGNRTLGNVATLVFVVLFLGIATWRLVSRPQERVPLLLPLAGAASLPESEISGLALDGESVILLPQYPGRFPEGELVEGESGPQGSLFGIESELIRERLAAARGGRELAPLEPFRIRFDDTGLRARVEGSFEGYEAMVLVDDTAYLLVEADREQGTYGVLVRGEITRDGSGRMASVRMQPASAVVLEGQTGERNLGYEALAFDPRRGELVAFYEANGVCNERPRALRFDRELRPQGETPLDSLEYRITDASSVDARGRLWTSNYFWPGATWEVGACALEEEHGRGSTHLSSRAVERLVQLEWSSAGIRPARRAPIQLELSGGDGRNWEGIVRFEHGFLIATDRFPETLFAYVED